MPDLFDIPETPSPKLLWLRKHRLHTANHGKDGWICRNGGWTKVAAGDAEDMAIINYCERHGLKHWTLETL